MDKIIYHITTPAQWQNAVSAGEYRADSLQTEGFIHCSLKRQINRSLNKYYAGHDVVILLHLNLVSITPRIVFEPSGGDQYPHIYGPINLDAVMLAEDIRPESDGTFTSYNTDA